MGDDIRAVSRAIAKRLFAFGRGRQREARPALATALCVGELGDSAPTALLVVACDGAPSRRPPQQKASQSGLERVERGRTERLELIEQRGGRHGAHLTV